MKTAETWRVVDDSQDYLVSSEGRIKSRERVVIRNNGRKHHVRERVLKTATDKNGYNRVGIVISGKLCTRKVHRLVAQAFLARQSTDTEVNHRNGNKSDNRVFILEWCTKQENIDHSFNCGLQENSIRLLLQRNRSKRKLTKEQVLFIRANYGVYKKTELAKMFNCDRKTLQSVYLKKTYAEY